ncbi:15226_t:CDS:2 [Cetraspora pellucida]|uniref:15226_t:CDS:1 n=1 Tax=Cetraspora pellucida TaxID=1433469 RepID=A0A9N9E2S1_9GLOM|nr:15226_t:CDS:2 [Cetraspora pellucida]
MKFNKSFYFLVLVICLIFAASTHAAPVPGDKDDKKESITIGKITAKEDEKKETFTITVAFSTKNAPKEDKLNAKLEACSDGGKVKDPSKKIVDADDKKVTFKVTVKDGKSAKFKVTLEDEDEEITATKTFTVKEGKEDCDEDKD